MNCVITNGACYIKRNSENLLVATDSLGEALLFPAEKAQATITYLPKALQDKGFKVKSVSEILGRIETAVMAEVGRSEQEQYEGGIPIKEGETLHNLKQALMVVDETLGSIQSTYVDACKELNDVSLEIIDLQHAIEFAKPNAVRKCYLETELQKALLRRRECKDVKVLIECVMEFNKCDWGTGKLQCKRFSIGLKSGLMYRVFVMICLNKITKEYFYEWSYFVIFKHVGFWCSWRS